MEFDTSMIVVMAVSIFSVMLLYELVIAPYLAGLFPKVGKHSYSCIKKSPRRKYYVSSGDYQIIILAETPEFAALEAYDKAPGGIQYDLYFYIDERGFRYEDATHKISIDTIIKSYREVSDGGET